jgi:hypothetical protein
VRLPLDCERAQQSKKRVAAGPATVTHYLAAQAPSKATAPQASAAAPQGTSAPADILVMKSA